MCILRNDVVTQTCPTILPQIIGGFLVIFISARRLIMARPTQNMENCTIVITYVGGHFTPFKIIINMGPFQINAKLTVIRIQQWKTSGNMSVKCIPPEHHFYIEKKKKKKKKKKLGYVGIFLFFLFLLQNIDCGYSLEPPRRSNQSRQSML